MLTDFITDFNLLTTIDLSQSNGLYTFIDRSNNTSRIDHFFISPVLQENVISCSIIDNHLYSDHIAVKLCLEIDMSYIVEIDRPYSVKNMLDKSKWSWYRTLSIKHRWSITTLQRHQLNANISMCYAQLINACSSADGSISTTSSRSHRSIPGWNDNIKYQRDDALSWY